MLLGLGRRHVISHRPQVVGREEHQLVGVDPFLSGAAEPPQELRDRVLLLSNRPLLLLDGHFVAGQHFLVLSDSVCESLCESVCVLFTFSQEQRPELGDILRQRRHVRAHAL